MHSVLVLLQVLVLVGFRFVWAVPVAMMMSRENRATVLRLRCRGEKEIGERIND